MLSESEILLLYKPADKVLTVNDTSRDLQPIDIILPECPPIEDIDGYGLHPEEQFFKKITYPDKLLDLENKGYTISEIWEILEREKHFYYEELRWIERQWDYRLNGYWFFNNGKPTYIDGWHYFYLNFWQLDVGLPEYRARDRKFFIFARMCYNDPNCYGFVYPKHRREGATSKTSCIHYEIISRTARAKGGIQGTNEKQAEMVFSEHIVNPFKNMAFFFKPEYEGSTDPKSHLSFTTPAIRVTKKGGIASRSTGLMSMIDYKSSEERAYDCAKLHFYHGDEAGKLKDVNVLQRHLIVKKCLAQGRRIHGFCIYTSTVGEMEKGGGTEFQNLCKGSNFYETTNNEQTATGLYRLFIPAYDGLDEYVDKYGDSDIEGARKFILGERKGFLEKGLLAELSETIRMMPIEYSECFRGNQKETRFNIYKLETRLDELIFNDKEVKRRGNFRWKDGKKDGFVEFVDDENGKFFLSKLLTDSESNKKMWSAQLQTWIPNNRNFVAGADPLKFAKTRNSQKSDAAGAVFWKRDISIDNDDKPIETWQSNRFVCTYENRPMTTDEYCEDMIMMVCYFGCGLNAEVNVPLLVDYMTARKYGGFILFQYNTRKQNFAATPGTFTGVETKQEIFDEYFNYVEYHIERDCHSELIKQILEIGSPDKMTDYDLFTAGGMALLGARSIYNNIQQQREQQYDIGKFY